MPLPTPNLDDRKFQDILDEARRLIPRYCPEWTDHNLSDPGITLLELFAWMTDMLLYRLNRVPDKNYVKFLELIGVRLQAARAATADITFRLSASQPGDVTIPRGTAVATVRTESDEATTFSTDRDLVIRVPDLTHVLASRGGTRFHDYQAAMKNPRQGLGIFNDSPRENDALYFGFSNDLAAHSLAITFTCRIEGIGVDPKDPPLIWETWSTSVGAWIPLRLELDTTGGLNRDGIVIVHGDFGGGPTIVDGKLGFWVRCRVLQPRPGQPGYSDTPRVTSVGVESLGAMVPATHAATIVGEQLGVSDGTPGQTFRVQYLPILPRYRGESVEVMVAPDDWEPWTEVSSFGSSGPDDKVFTIDDVSGTVEFGPRLRTPQGTERQYGAAPAVDARIRFSSYRWGGGTVGNVGAMTLTNLKSSIPYVQEVMNLGPATGGTDPEDLEHARWRGPEMLRRRDRAVTGDDFEVLAREASPAVSRARALSVSTPADASRPPGVVRLLLVPAAPAMDGPVPPEQLQVSARVRHQVQAYLDERRMLTSEIVLESPTYTWVTVAARVRARRRASRERILQKALATLYRFIHPSVGGQDGRGWPFGRELYVGEVYAVLQQVDGIDTVEEVTLQQFDPVTGAFGRPTTRITVDPHGLLCSHEHRIQVG